ncbi:hypothetical protein HK102_014034 [Quaeritorhiza haematococci]|nr:hypothetical protein HK102_014034 [Quaeritorhiza haematococci]
MSHNRPSSLGPGLEDFNGDDETRTLSSRTAQLNHFTQMSLSDLYVHHIHAPSVPRSGNIPSSSLGNSHSHYDDSLPDSIRPHRRFQRASMPGPSPPLAASNSSNPLGENLEVLEQLKRFTKVLYKKGFLSGLYSDIVVEALGMKYNLHRIVLLQNDYFAAMLTGGVPGSVGGTELGGDYAVADKSLWKEHGEQSIQLKFDDPNITVHAITLVLERMYGQFNTPITSETATSILATAAFFGDKDLCNRCIDFILTIDLSESTLLRYLLFADDHFYGSYSESILDAVFTTLCREGYENQTLHGVFVDMPLKWFERIVASDCFFVPSEYERYVFIRNILNERKKKGEPTPSNPVMTRSNSENSMIKSTSSSTLVDSSDSEAANDGENAEEDFQEEEEIDMDTLLYKSIIFGHLGFNELLQIRNDGDVPERVLQRAYWSQQEWRCKIESAAETKVDLGIPDAYRAMMTARSDSKRDSLYERQQQQAPQTKFGFIPTDDTDKIDGRRIYEVLSADPPAYMYFGGGGSDLQDLRKYRDEGGVIPVSPSLPMSWTPFPPFRFSFEFRHLRSLQTGSRSYSKTMFYAGSYWVLYLQKMVVDSVPKLGIYLQRLQIDESDLLDAHSNPHDTSLPSSSPQSSFSGSPQLTSPSHRLASKTRSEYYVDPRKEVKTWFKLFCYVCTRGKPKRTHIPIPRNNGGRPIQMPNDPSSDNSNISGSGSSSSLGSGNAVARKCYILESKPDMFRNAQSWGWRSNRLYKDAMGMEQEAEKERERRDFAGMGLMGNRDGGDVEVTLRCCVVMGHV